MTKEEQRAYNLKWQAAHPGYGREQYRKWRAKPGNRERANASAKRRRSSGPVKLKHDAEVKAWWAANPGYHKKWRKKNRVKQNEYSRLQQQKYRAENPEKFKTYRRSYRKENRERELELRRKRYQVNRDKLLQKTKQWRKKNGPRILEYNSQRRAKKLSLTTEDCTAKSAELKLRPFCHYCCTRLTDKNRTEDHVTPLSRGGRHCPDNLVAACKFCNSSKGKKLISEWTWEMAA